MADPSPPCRRQTVAQAPPPAVLTTPVARTLLSANNAALPLAGRPLSVGQANRGAGAPACGHFPKWRARVPAPQLNRPPNGQPSGVRQPCCRPFLA